MTKEQIPSRISMPCPFGRDLGAGTGNITPVESVQGNNVNFIDGFPSIYGAPSSNSGKFVTRKEMNGLGNLATNDLFYHKCGGLNTFDADFCTAIGGYPKDAVLKMVGGNNTLFDVISLVDNNTYNFIENGIDNEHWKILNLNIGYPFVDRTVLSWEGIHEFGVTMIGSFVAPKDGSVFVTSTPTLSFEDYATLDPGGGTFYNGIGIVICPHNTVLTETNITNVDVRAIGIKSNWFGNVIIPSHSSSSASTTFTVTKKNFTTLGLQKGQSYTAYIVSSQVEFSSTSGTYSPSTGYTGPRYKLSGKLEIGM